MGISPAALGAAILAIASVGLVVSGTPVLAQTQPVAQPIVQPAGQPVVQPAGQPIAQPAQATVQTSRAYRIRQGDTLDVMIYGETALSPPGPVTVAQGGMVELPLVGGVVIGGLTTSQASAAIAQKLRKYVRDPRVTVAVQDVGPVEALVLGNVKTPGKYTLSPPARVTDVIAAAGGLGPTNGALPDARIESPEGATSTISLQKLLHDGDAALDKSIESGSTVYVPSPTTFSVIVQGAVDKPGDVMMEEGDDVARAVARAGASSNSNPDLNRVIVRRAAPDGTIKTYTINLYPILKNGDLSNDLKMQKGDIVFVPQAAKHSSILDLLTRF